MIDNPEAYNHLSDSVATAIESKVNKAALAIGKKVRKLGSQGYYRKTYHDPYYDPVRKSLRELTSRAFVQEQPNATYQHPFAYAALQGLMLGVALARETLPDSRMKRFIEGERKRLDFLAVHISSSVYNLDEILRAGGRDYAEQLKRVSSELVVYDRRSEFVVEEEAQLYADAFGFMAHSLITDMVVAGIKGQQPTDRKANNEISDMANHLSSGAVILTSRDLSELLEP